eukprot:15449982-Alexandrium_andersonii.AAC.1
MAWLAPSRMRPSCARRRSCPSMIPQTTAGGRRGESVVRSTPSALKNRSGVLAAHEQISLTCLERAWARVPADVMRNGHAGFQGPNLFQDRTQKSS